MLDPDTTAVLGDGFITFERRLASLRILGIADDAFRGAQLFRAIKGIPRN